MMCGTMNEPDWSFCQHCGAQLHSQAAKGELPTVVSEAVVQAAAPEAREVQARPDLSTVVDQPVVAQPAQAPAHTEHVRSEPLPTVACPQCGALNQTDSLYCSGCGAGLRIAQTVVMASVPAPAKGQLNLIMEGGQVGETWELKDDTAIGRNSGDITFPHDGFMSGRHARVIRRGGSFFLVDESSRNGTFIKIKGEVELKSGDMVLIGRQLFRFEA
jgi:hypothetical protein